MLTGAVLDSRYDEITSNLLLMTSSSERVHAGCLAQDQTLVLAVDQMNGRKTGSVSWQWDDCPAKEVALPLRKL